MQPFLRRVLRNVFRPRQQELNCESLPEFVSVASGVFSPKKLTLFSIFRDEIYFCRAFFDHYRKIGIEQFLILDDGSSDGTESFLRAQSDCVTLTSSLSFGQNVRYRLPQQAASSKQQAASSKQQAASSKQQAAAGLALPSRR